MAELVRQQINDFHIRELVMEKARELGGMITATDLDRFIDMVAREFADALPTAAQAHRGSPRRL